MARKTIDYEQVGEDYHEHRKLKRGAAGWILLAGLGVAYVISGDFAGWNFGLAEGGWGGLLIATILMAVMYTCMVLGLAEMSSSLPVAGAGYAFARRAMGPLGGFATGMAVLIEYAVAPAAIATFIGGYVEALGLFGLTNGWVVYLIAYAIFVGIHLYGVGEALKLMFAITAIAVVALVAAVIGLLPDFSTSNMLDIKVDTGAAMSSDFLPFGIAGVVGALVYGIWFFLAIEGVPLAAEEADDPARDMPKGIIGGMLTLLLFAALILFIVPGAAGSSVVQGSDNPLPEAIRAVRGDGSVLADFVNYAGLAGLIASFFSIIYAYSRQLFALSRAGYLPKSLSLTSGRNTPWVALIVPGTIGFILATIPVEHHGDPGRRRRAAHQHRGVRRDGLLRAAQPQPHPAAAQGTRTGAAVPHSRWCGDHRRRPGAQCDRGHRDVLRRREGRRHHRAGLHRGAGVLLVLQPAPPGALGPRGGVRRDRGGGVPSPLTTPLGSRFLKDCTRVPSPRVTRVPSSR